MGSLLVSSTPCSNLLLIINSDGAVLNGHRFLTCGKIRDRSFFIGNCANKGVID